MKNFYGILLLILFSSCGSSNYVSDAPNLENVPEEDVVRIANDDLEYEIIIIEPGFNAWLQGIAQPEGFYSQNYMETRNIQWVTEWNRRVIQPFQFDPNLYQLQIDYQPQIDYGYEVNYKLFNYLVYFQITYKQRLGGFMPRI